MTLEELGALLGERREALGLSKADIAERLKYTESRIGEIERGDLSSMPHAAYAKGLLRTYAQTLGLNPSEGEIAEALKSLAPQEELKPFEPDRTARPRRDTRWVGIVLSLGFFGLICLGLWRLGLVDFVRDKAKDMQTASPMQSKDPLRNMPKAPEAPAGQQATRPDPASAKPANPNMPAGRASAAKPAGASLPANPNMPANLNMPAASVAAQRPAPMHSPAQINPSMPAGAGSSTSAGSPTTQPASPSLPANPNLPEPATVRQPLQGTVPAGSPWGTLKGNATLAGQAGLADPQPGASPASPGMQPGSPAAQGAPDAVDLQALPGQHKIVIAADETCWMQATPDGGKAQQHTMKAGETLSFPFSAKLVLRLGNAGGVRIWYDGQEFGERGRSGQVRTLHFPPAPQP